MASTSSLEGKPHDLHPDTLAISMFGTVTASSNQNYITNIRQTIIYGIVSVFVVVVSTGGLVLLTHLPIVHQSNGTSKRLFSILWRGRKGPLSGCLLHIFADIHRRFESMLRF